MSYRGRPEATILTNRLEGMLSDTGLDWGIRKCGAIHVKGGKLHNTENLPLQSGSQILVLGEQDDYKILGKLQNVNQLDKQVFEQASQEYLRRLAAILTSPISIPRKVRTTNTFAYPVRRYYMWSSERAMDDRQELDRKTQAVIAHNKGKHHSELIPTLYQPPDVGGSGVKETVIV